MDLGTIRRRASDAVAWGRAVLGSGVAVAKAKGGRMIPLLLSPIGRTLATVAIAAIAWFGWLANHDRKVVSRVSAKIEQKVTEHAKQADTERATVSTLPAERLRDKYTRD
jgi:hypothetical protein